MNVLLLSIVLPFVFGLACFLLPKEDKKLSPLFALTASAITSVACFEIFALKPLYFNIGTIGCLWVDVLSGFIAIFIGLFSFLIIIYSMGFMKGRENLNKFYAYVLWTLAASLGAVFANHLVVFLMFWGILGITLYLLIAMGTEGAHASAKKTFIIIGGADAFMLLGVALLWKLSPALEMNMIHVPLTSSLATLAFVCLALGAFAKAGAMPLHTWIPDSAETAPTPVMAFLPASLDKLLGIYFLFRISVGMFAIQPHSALSLFLIIIGSITIIAAVMMALVQHNLKKLLSYHAVSQVGYMVLGIGTANPIGIAGGLFHMLNHAIYKSCLFLAGGNVEHQAGTNDLNKLGGLARPMPFTFIAFLIASFSISGIPPFNGFVSKWMVYQGIIEMGRTGEKLWPLWLAVAMFGSALTLASFMKLIHAIFLGQPSGKKESKVKEVPFLMNISPLILAALCIVFGVFALQVPVRLFIAPSVPQQLGFIGVWNSSQATLLIFAGFIIGFIIYSVGKYKTFLTAKNSFTFKGAGAVKTCPTQQRRHDERSEEFSCLLGSRKAREVNQFIGGEALSLHPDMKPSGVEFYNMVKEIGILKFMYQKAEDKWFDIYELGKKLTFSVSAIFQYLHNGILSTYTVWYLLGMIGLFYYVFLR